jgi:hypothetical protein
LLNFLVASLCTARPRKRDKAIQVERINTEELINAAAKTVIAKAKKSEPSPSPPTSSTTLNMPSRNSNSLLEWIESRIFGQAGVATELIRRKVSRFALATSEADITRQTTDEIRQRIVTSNLLHEKESPYYVELLEVDDAAHVADLSRVELQHFSYVSPFAMTQSGI